MLLTRIDCGLDPTVRDSQGKTASDHMKEEKDVDDSSRESWLLVRFWLLQAHNLWERLNVRRHKAIRACLQLRRLHRNVAPAASSSAAADLLAAPAERRSSTELLLSAPASAPEPAAPTIAMAASIPREVVNIILSYHG